MLVSVWRIMLSLWVSSVLVVISLPWSKFDGTPHWENVQLIPFAYFNLHPAVLIETLLNILAFVPVGYLAVRSVPRSSQGGVILALAVGVSSSVGIELYQLFCQQRVASISDVLMNVGGTAIGSWLAFAIDQILCSFAVEPRRSTT